MARCGRCAPMNSMSETSFAIQQFSCPAFSSTLENSLGYGTKKRFILAGSFQAPTDAIQSHQRTNSTLLARVLGKRGGKPGETRNSHLFLNLRLRFIVGFSVDRS